MQVFFWRVGYFLVVDLADERLVEEGNEEDGFVGANGPVSDRLHAVRVEIVGLSQAGILLEDVALEVGRQQICALLWQDTEQLLEWLEGRTLVKLRERLAALQQITEIVLQIGE